VNQKDVNELLSHLVFHFQRVLEDDIEPELAYGTLDALAGDFMTLHDHLASGGLIPDDWS